MTPPLSSSALGGITRRSVMQLAEDLGIPAAEASIPREMLYIADEVFFTGTAAEITPIRSIDKITVANGKTGPVTQALQKEFFAILQGKAPDRYNWFTPLPVTSRQPVTA